MYTVSRLLVKTVDDERVRRGIFSPGWYLGLMFVDILNDAVWFVLLSLYSSCGGTASY